MTFLTDFADQAVILPMVFATAIALTMQGWRRAALAWVLVVGTTLATIVVLKLLFLACPASFGTSEIRTPSGHVAAATVVAGGLAALLHYARGGHRAFAGLALAAALIAPTAHEAGVMAGPLLVAGLWVYDRAFARRHLWLLLGLVAASAGEAAG